MNHKIEEELVKMADGMRYAEFIKKRQRKPMVDALKRIFIDFPKAAFAFIFDIYSFAFEDMGLTSPAMKNSIVLYTLGATFAIVSVTFILGLFLLAGGALLYAFIWISQFIWPLHVIVGIAMLLRWLHVRQRSESEEE